MGRQRDSGLAGVLAVDKPAGMTSHDVVAVVRRLTGQRRVGHTGTLDPDATGVLVLCFGRATKLVRFLQDSPKTYRTTAVLGRTTTTLDAAGEIADERDASAITADDVRAALVPLTGAILQVPPMVSALKVDGERLYDLARRGEVVEREPRPVTVHRFELLELRPGVLAEADLEVTCSPGTYVRSLVADLGRELAVGASLRTLRRTANAGLDVSEAIPLDELERRLVSRRPEDLLTSTREAATAALPTVTIHDRELLTRLVHGQALPAAGHEGPYAVVAGAELVGIYADRDGRGRPEVVLLRPDELDTVELP